jgi:hypothetical protein
VINQNLVILPNIRDNIPPHGLHITVGINITKKRKKMEFPKRVDQHIIETDSYKIFSNNIPSKWIIRDISERDYGVDCYIEIVNENNQLTGDLVSIQLKGISSEINWTKNETYNISGIKISTSNYWNNFQTPVFIFVIDTLNQKVYYEPVKSAIRKSYANYNKQLTFSYTIEKKNEITVGNFTDFLSTFYKEKNLLSVENNIISYISNYEKYIEYTSSYYNRDCFLGVENSRIIYLKQFYNNTKFLCENFDFNWQLKPFIEYQKDSIKKFGDDYSLYELDHDLIVDELEKKIKPLLTNIKNRITIDEFEYWIIKDLPLFNVVENIKDDGTMDTYWD